MRKSKYLAMLAVALALSFSLVTAAPVLAAPIVASVTETAFGTDAKAHHVDMPATTDAGDLLIVLFTNDGRATVTTPVGWTQLASNAKGRQVRLSVYYKIAAGTEGGTTVNFVTSRKEQAAAQVYRITDWHGTTPPEISTAATGKDAAPDPACLDLAGWDVADTLWLAVAGQDRGDQGEPTAYPASYTDGISTLSSEGSNSCRTHSARRALAAASENPGAFTIPVLEQWVAFTIAVRPRPRVLTTSSAEGGSVNTPGEGVFTYDEGTVVALVATPDECYRFDRWTGDVGTIADVNSASTNITMSGDYSITANFAKISYNLTTDSTAGGSVTTPGENTFTYDCGTVVDLVAQADACYEFVNWTGDVGTIADVNSASTNITMSGDYSITANFIRQHNLTLSSTEGGSVTEPGEGVFTYDGGPVLELIATADEDYLFVEWTGDVGTIADVHAATTTITVNGDYSITASFESLYPTVTTEVATNITAKSAILNMSYTVGDFSPVQVRFAYKESASRFWSSTDWVSESASGTYAVSLSGLVSNTQYDFKAQLRHNGTMIEGAILQFATRTPPPWGSRIGCFIATAAYGTPTAKAIDVLREFRDDVLLKSTVGSQFVALYYQFSPPVANVIAGNEVLRTLVRELLIDPIVSVVQATGDIWRN